MMELARDNPWTGSPSFFDYANEFSFQWILTIAAVSLLLVPYAAQTIRFLREPRLLKNHVSNLTTKEFLALSTIVTGLSYFVLIYLAYFLGMGWPFPRNAVAAIWLLVLGFTSLPTIATKFARLIYPLLTVTALIGFYTLGSELRDGDWRRINPVLTESVPVAIRDLEHNGVTHVVCSSFDAPACILSIGILQSQGISMQLGDGLIPDLPCVIGTRKPPPKWQVRLYKHDQIWGQLCH
jgi:hypothetical protein